MGTTTQSPAVRRASAQQRTTADQQALGRMRRPPDDEDDDQWPPRVPSSAVRYSLARPVSPARQPALEPVAPRRGRALYLLVPVFFVCLGAVLAAYIPPTVQQWRDGSTYGYPRTFQTNAAVGHGDPSSPSSHFIALNLSGVLEVIEIPGGDPGTYQPQLYRLATLTGPGADLVVITVSFADINSDGKLDMVASYSGTETILFNNGKTFVFKL